MPVKPSFLLPSLLLLSWCELPVHLLSHGSTSSLSCSLSHELSLKLFILCFVEIGILCNMNSCLVLQLPVLLYFLPPSLSRDSLTLESLLLLCEPCRGAFTQKLESRLNPPRVSLLLVCFLFWETWCPQPY